MSAPTQWHCYRWSGRTADIRDAQRNDPSQPVPPNRVQEWLMKPRSMRQATYHSLPEVEAWVREQIRAVEGQILGGEVLSSYDQQAAGVVSIVQSTADHAANWTRWLRGGNELVELAVVGA